MPPWRLSFVSIGLECLQMSYSKVLGRAIRDHVLLQSLRWPRLNRKRTRQRSNCPILLAHLLARCKSVEEWSLEAAGINPSNLITRHLMALCKCSLEYRCYSEAKSQAMKLSGLERRRVAAMLRRSSLSLESRCCRSPDRLCPCTSRHTFHHRLCHRCCTWQLCLSSECTLRNWLGSAMVTNQVYTNARS